MIDADSCVAATGSRRASELAPHAFILLNLPRNIMSRCTLASLESRFQLRFMLMIAVVGSAMLASAPSALAQSAAGESVAGVWRGRWTSTPAAGRREHSGTLRVRLIQDSHLAPNGATQYRGTFSGRFAVVIPYFYRASVTQSGNQLYSSKKLGPLGQYEMIASMPNTNSIGGRWFAGKHTGGIQLRRRR